MDPSRNLDVIGGIVAAIAGVVWLVRLEGRVNALAQSDTELKSDIAEIKHDVKMLLIRMGPNPWNERREDRDR